MLTHFNETGEARMVDVGAKPETLREAVAAGAITLSAQAYRLLRDGQVAKGDVLGVARVAGIMAAKRVDYLIPFAHSLRLTSVQISYQFEETTFTLNIQATVAAHGRTGVEMEALTAVSIVALTVYDMLKAVDRGMVIGNIRLLSKTGGKSGSYRREKDNSF